MKKISLYMVVSALLAANGGILALFHNDPLVGSILAGLGTVAAVGHTFLSGEVITIPAGVYNWLSKANAALVGLLSVSGVLTGWIATSHSPQAIAVTAVVLQGFALVAGVFAQLFKSQVAAKLAAQSKVVPLGGR